MFIAQSIDQLPDRDLILSMSGLAFLQAMLEGHISSPPISAVMNFQLSFVSPGKVIFTGAPKFEHTNPHSGVHGGWYGTLLDSCMACAVLTEVPKGASYTTLEYKVNLTRAIPINTQIKAIGTVDHAGRRTGVSHGEIRGVADGKLYATGSTTCLIMQIDHG